MKLGRFIAAWIASSIAMFFVSYIWHGVVLNDFQKVTLPDTYFMVLFTLVYLAIGAVLAFLFTKIEFDSNVVARRMLMGAALGFFIYLITFVLGVSFNTGKLEHIVMDFGWQMTEQAIGALTVSAVFKIAAVRAKLAELRAMQND